MLSIHCKYVFFTLTSRRNYHRAPCLKYIWNPGELLSGFQGSTWSKIIFQKFENQNRNKISKNTILNVKKGVVSLFKQAIWQWKNKNWSFLPLEKVLMELVISKDHIAWISPSIPHPTFAHKSRHDQKISFDGKKRVEGGGLWHERNRKVDSHKIDVKDVPFCYFSWISSNDE